MLKLCLLAMLQTVSSNIFHFIADPVKRGHVPSTAIKPPPSNGGKPKIVKSGSTSSEPPEVDYFAIENSQSPKEPPKLPLKPKPQAALNDSEDPSELDGAASGGPPSVPSKALKPKLKIHSVDETLLEEDEQDDGKLSLPSEGDNDIISKKAAPPTPSKSLKPKLKKETLSEEEEGEEKLSLPHEDNVDKVNKKSAPPTPSKALKPKIEKYIEESSFEQEAEENLTLPKSKDDENAETEEEEKSEPKSVSSETEAEDDSTVKTPQNPIVSEDNFSTTTEDKQGKNITPEEAKLDAVEKQITNANEKIGNDENISG